MENNIQLVTSPASNSYVHHFKIAQFNLRLLIKEESVYGKRYKRRLHPAKS
jgi:hypothetical protein